MLFYHILLLHVHVHVLLLHVHVHVLLLHVHVLLLFNIYKFQNMEKKI